MGLGGPIVCILGVALLAMFAGLIEGGVDVTINPNAFNPYITRSTFTATSCAVQEQCVKQAGNRRLLRFTTQMMNIGNTALQLGAANQNNRYFYYSNCRNRWQRNDRVLATLTNLQTGVVISSVAKIGFCLLDSQANNGGNAQGRFGCNNQGLSPGFSDFYGANIECNWVDITDAPDGRYVLTVEANSNHIWQEDNYDNNKGSMGILIAGDVVTTFPAPAVLPSPVDTPIPVVIPTTTLPPVTQVPIVKPPPSLPPPPPTTQPQITSQPSTPSDGGCTTAVLLTLDQPNTGSTTNALAASQANVLPRCRNILGGGGISWYKIIGNGQTLTATLCDVATSFDTIISVFSTDGNAGACNLACVTANDDAAPTCRTRRLASQASWCAEVGKEYLIAISGYRNQRGNFKLLVRNANQAEQWLASRNNLNCLVTANNIS